MKDPEPAPSTMTPTERKVIVASTVRSVFEWYDFCLYGSLAPIIGAPLFSEANVTTRDISTSGRN